MSDDLLDLQSQDTTTWTPIHPVLKRPINGADGTPWTWTIYGPGHPKLIEAQERSRIRRRQRARNGIEVDDKTLEKESVEGVVTNIQGWTPIKLGGDVLEFSREAAFDLLVNDRFGWLYVSFVKYLANDANFIKPSDQS